MASVDGQRFTDYEHLVIDGASSDGTLSIAELSPNTRRIVLSEPDNGIYDAMNRGRALAQGRYLIFLNAGDKFHNDLTLGLIADAIAANDNPGIVYGQTNIVDDHGLLIGPRHLTAPAELTLASFAQGMVVCHQAFVVLNEIAPYYSLKYRFSADYDWCIQCLQHSRHNVGLTDTVLIDYLEGGATAKNHRKSLWERFCIMRYYYGTVPTVLRHIKFLCRNCKRRIIH